MLLDTSGLLAAMDASQRQHRACAEALAAAKGARLLSPFVLAELDYLLATRVGERAQLALLDEVARGVYQVESFDRADTEQAAQVMRRYADLRIGIADASLVVLAARHSVKDVLTLDHRHFGAMRQASGRPFRILPAMG